VIEADRPRRLVTTFAERSGEGGENDRPSRVTWLVEKKGETCKLTLTHDDFDGETKTYKSVGPGWNPVLSGLKTLLETGEAATRGSAEPDLQRAPDETYGTRDQTRTLIIEACCSAKPASKFCC
jgi:hypothetical protein